MLTLYSADSKINQKQFYTTSGIYAICYEEKIIYIGQSRQIGKRIASHMSKTKLERTIKLQQRTIEEGRPINYQYAITLYQFIKENRKDIKFCILKECSQQFLNSEEEKFIKLYTPKFNYAGIKIPFISYSPKK